MKNKILLYFIFFSSCLISCEKLNPFDKRLKFCGNFYGTIRHYTESWGTVINDTTYSVTIKVERHLAGNNSLMLFKVGPYGIYPPKSYLLYVYKNGSITGDDGDSHTGNYSGKFVGKNYFSFSVSGHDYPGVDFSTTIKGTASN